MCVYIYIYMYTYNVHIYIYIYIERERDVCYTGSSGGERLWSLSRTCLQQNAINTPSPPIKSFPIKSP